MYHFMSTETGPLLQLVLRVPDLGFPLSIVKRGTYLAVFEKSEISEMPTGYLAVLAALAPLRKKMELDQLRALVNGNSPLPMLMKLQIHNAAGLLICFVL